MLHVFSTGLVVAAFAGAGLFNAVGTAAQQASFARWGYPAWWCRVTGVLELAVAFMVAFPASRLLGLSLGAIIMAAAALTVVRHREFSHLAPIGVFVVLLIVTALSS